MIHVGGISTEACKNLVLAGVGFVAVLDPRNVTEEDLATQFLFSQDAIGKNVSVERILKFFFFLFFEFFEVESLIFFFHFCLAESRVLPWSAGSSESSC